MEIIYSFKSNVDAVDAMLDNWQNSIILASDCVSLVTPLPNARYHIFLICTDFTRYLKMSPTFMGLEPWLRVLLSRQTDLRV